MNDSVDYDEIGWWSEAKLDIIERYATEYSKIMDSQEKPSFEHLYVDAFAGAGKHKRKGTGEFVSGSPVNALKVEPSFMEYHFIDLDQAKVEELEKIANRQEKVFVHHGDCNKILLDDVFPRAEWDDFRRALCILDPYGIHLNWDVIQAAGEMHSVEIFLNFPIMDMHRNVLWENPNDVSTRQVRRMNQFWGDDSWRDVAWYKTGQTHLFGGEMEVEKASHEKVASAFQKRLKEKAGFKYVPAPVLMRNDKNAPIYYLFFASQNPTAREIVDWLFSKYSA